MSLLLKAERGKSYVILVQSRQLMMEGLEAGTIVVPINHLGYSVICYVPQRGRTFFLPSVTEVAEVAQG